jgi:CheY-like chemotaxis protein
VTPTRVLIVDDNPINIELAEFILRAQGFVVSCANGAAAAIERARESRPHVVLMDIQLPEVDGLEVARRLRADAVLRDVVIIAFTAYAMKGDEQKLLSAGCDGYIAKPIDVATFGQAIRACMAAKARA